ncbi:hypothetical protein BT63DRAFT_373088 [Microthyrium microscopicum]|uniref:Fucose-specific lectin n=1 Tax=Microthyrium microscopicum TaxID=703497 RepID=A0A6A6UBK7_9PEZI|nr:hypothetical protein BT63DRAFT_373088 [Microthyrium microscopicum]
MTAENTPIDSGLEVVRRSTDLPEVVNHPPAPEFQIGERYEKGQSGALPPEYTDQHPGAPTKPRRKRTLWIVFAVLFIIVAIVAIVVGVVLGTRESKDTTKSGSTAGSSSGDINTTLLRKNSPLAVTGWRNGSSLNVRLFYQGDDGNIRMNGYESGSKKWTASPPIDTAKAGTALAASCFNASNFFAAPNATGSSSLLYFQIELFYTNNASLIKEWNFNESSDTGASGSISSLTFRTGASSRMSSYWPSLVFQDDSGTLTEIFYNSSVSQQAWNQRGLGLVGRNNSGLAEVPLTTNLAQNTNTPVDFGMGIFYQRDDFKPFDATRGTNLGAWSANNLNVSIPQNSSIGSFSVPRAGDSAKRTNLYVLWQDASGNIQYNWQDDNSGWKGPATSDALKGADLGTSIACLTPTIWPVTDLQPKFDLSRCYYQVGGSLREVQFDGSNWNVLGFVPLTGS